MLPERMSVPESDLMSPPSPLTAPFKVVLLEPLTVRLLVARERLPASVRLPDPALKTSDAASVRELLTICSLDETLEIPPPPITKFVPTKV